MEGGHREPGTSPVASLVILRTQGRTKTSCRGNHSPEGLRELTRVTEKQGETPGLSDPTALCYYNKPCLVMLEILSSSGQPMELHFFQVIVPVSGITLN